MPYNYLKNLVRHYSTSLEKLSKYSEWFWSAKKREKELWIYVWRFPDTNSAATEGTGVFEEDAAVDDVEVEEVDEADVRAELDEGSKSNENYLNDLF